jgi:hypothetical protein
MRYIYVKEFEDKLSVDTVIPWIKIGGGEVRPLVAFDDAGIYDVVFVSRYDTISDEDLHNHRIWIWEDCTEAVSLSISRELAIYYDYYHYLKVISIGKSDKDVSTLFTGSSFGMHGIDGRLISHAVNLSVSAQDLYYCFKGISEVCSQNHNIRNIVFCCNYYFFYEDMSAHSDDWHQTMVASIYDNIYGDIHNRPVLNPAGSYLVRSDVFDVERLLHNTFSTYISQNYYNENRTRLSARGAGYKGWKNMSFEEREEEAIERTSSINRLFKWKYTYNANMELLHKLCDFCADRNINLMFVVSPLTELFKKYYCPEFRKYFYKALENAPGEIHLLDLYDDSSYIDEDFVDAYHLDDSGAEKMTKTILEALREINKA